MKGERTSKQQNYFYFITKPNYFITIFLHHVLLWEAKLKILARKRKALNIGGVASEAYIWCCQWHPFKYSKQRSHTRQSLSRMTHRRKRIFSSLKKCKKVDRVITTQPTLTTNIFFRLIFV